MKSINAINPAKINLVAAIVAIAFAANSSSAGSFEAASSVKPTQRLSASVQLADPSIEEVNGAMYPERSFKKLKCTTNTQCEVAAAKRVEQLDKQIAKLQAQLNKTGANLVKLNDKFQLLKAERKHLMDDSKQ